MVGWMAGKMAGWRDEYWAIDEVLDVVFTRLRSAGLFCGGILLSRMSTIIGMRAVDGMMGMMDPRKDTKMCGEFLSNPKSKKGMECQTHFAKTPTNKNYDRPSPNTFL